MTREPSLYALLHRGTPGDEDFYRRICRDQDSVLEFGCGAARLMLPLLRAGHRVTGIDSDPGLLELARSTLASLPEAEERATLHRGDMRSVSLPQRFDRVIIPYNGLYCLASAHEQAACLANAARHLKPGGRVIFDAYAIDAFHFEADEDADATDGEPVASIPWRDTVWDVFEHCDWTRAAQRLHVHYEYRPRDGSTAVYQRIDHRYLLTAELPGLCQAAGLQVLDAAGGFQGEALNSDSEHLTCIATPFTAGVR